MNVDFYFTIVIVNRLSVNDFSWHPKKLSANARLSCCAYSCRNYFLYHDAKIWNRSVLRFIWTALYLRFFDVYVHVNLFPFFLWSVTRCALCWIWLIVIFFVNFCWTMLNCLKSIVSGPAIYYFVVDTSYALTTTKFKANVIAKNYD